MLYDNLTMVSGMPNKEKNDRITVLIVDDEEVVRTMLEQLLLSSGYHVLTSPTSESAIHTARNHPVDLALLDYQLPDMNGIQLMLRLREITPSILSIIMTGYGTIERAVEAMQAGAWDFIPKPITFNMLIEKLDRIEEVCRLKRDHDYRHKVVNNDFYFNGVVGTSSSMQPVYEAIIRASESSLPVLIEGETGSGKEIVAEAIHVNSKRSSNPYIVMDCTATPHSLIESTLFGSTKGAFTGSVERKGLLQAADGGTLFLDEVGEIELDIQPKLLRCLETKRFRPVGSTKEISSNFRIICATNRDLLAETKKGAFRTDLFYRISAQRIKVPPLRERTNDIPLLSNHFLLEIAKEHNRKPLELAPEATQKLCNYHWPGNIRQLKFVIEAAFFHATDNMILPADLHLDTAETDVPAANPSVFLPDLDKDFKTYRDEAILEAERKYLTLLLEKNEGDVRTAAQQAGLTREALYRVMSRCGLSPNQFRPKTER